MDKKQKKTINPINNDDTYFQYATAVALNEKEKGTNSQRKQKNKAFINKYNWKGISFTSGKNDWKKKLRKII